MTMRASMNRVSSGSFTIDMPRPRLVIAGRKGVGDASGDTPVRGSHRLEVLEGRKLLEANFALVGRVVTFACRRYRFDLDDAEDFRSVVHMKLVENEFAILRSYASRSSLSTYLSIVIQHWALDYRIHEWGKWHASAEAKRLGAVAVELEQLLYRDGRSIEEAFPFLAVKHPGMTLDELRKLAARLPR